MSLRTVDEIEQEMILEENTGKLLLRYDYDNQAWVKNGKYVACNHPDSMNCKCYGRLHEGETA